MKNDIPLLKNQAAKAVPSWPRRRPGPVGRWSPLWPVYAELRRKGFSIREAIDWLIREGVVPAADRKKAEYGLPMADSRQRYREAVARGENPVRRKRKKAAKKAAAKTATHARPASTTAPAGVPPAEDAPTQDSHPGTLPNVNQDT